MPFLAILNFCINIDKYFTGCYDFQQVKVLFGVKGAFPFYNLTIKKREVTVIAIQCKTSSPVLPFIVLAYYHSIPSFGEVINLSTISILMIYIPVGISEALSYTRKVSSRLLTTKNLPQKKTSNLNPMLSLWRAWGF